MNHLEKISEKITLWLGTPISIGIHTLFFVGIFFLRFLGFSTDDILLILTTVVSLEAIYLSIFIQMSVNKAKATIAGVEKDIDDIQEDVEGLETNVKEISEDIEDISEEEDEDDELIKTIKDIETKIVKLHKELKEIKSTPRGNRTPITSSED